MFARRFFAGRMFAPRYFPPVSVVVVVTPDQGGGGIRFPYQPPQFRPTTRYELYRDDEEIIIL
jgi:hypothetical protein